MNYVELFNVCNITCIMCLNLTTMQIDVMLMNNKFYIHRICYDRYVLFVSYICLCIVNIVYWCIIMYCVKS